MAEDRDPKEEGVPEHVRAIIRNFAQSGGLVQHLQIPQPEQENMVEDTIVNPGESYDKRKSLLWQLINNEDQESEQALTRIMDGRSQAKSKKLAEERQKLSEAIRQMEQGPLRSGIILDSNAPGGAHRVTISLFDGDRASCLVVDEKLFESLERGDLVWIDQMSKVVLFKDINYVPYGEEVRLERPLDEGQLVEIQYQGEKRIIYTAKPLQNLLQKGEVKKGQLLIASPRHSMAFQAVPYEEDELAKFQFLEKQPIPNVDLDMLGMPPTYLETAIRHMHLEMSDPELSEIYNLRRTQFHLLAGVSGSGKTYSILALWRMMYELMSGHYNIPMNNLPPRVLKLKCSKVLSKWLGESDQRIDRFFDEVEELADMPYEGHRLPLLVICEEIDGLAAERGENTVYDRIQTNLLNRLDPTNSVYKDKMITFVCTTNVAHLVDPAFLRRVGGQVEHFGRLERQAFEEVLSKHLTARPLCSAFGQDNPHAKAVQDLSNWLFSGGEDQEQVDLIYDGDRNSRDTKRREDFLTAGLVDRAVEQAATEARQQHREATDPGLSMEMLTRAFSEQVDTIVEQLHVKNVRNYLTLPDSLNITGIERH